MTLALACYALAVALLTALVLLACWGVAGD